MPNINLRYSLSTFTILTFIALVTFLPSLHFMPKVIIWYTDSQRLLELLLLVLILLNASLCINKNNPIITKLTTFNILHFGLFLLLIFTTISTYLAQSPRHALIEVATFAGLCYLSIFVIDLYQQNKQFFIKGIIYSVWISIALYMTSFYVGYVTACIFKTSLNWPLPFTGFSNIRSFNQYQLWTLGLVYLPLLAFNLKSNMKALLHISLVCWWILLYYSASRGVLIAWMVGIFITAITYRKSAWLFLRLQILSMLLGYGAYYLLFEILPHLLNSTLITGTILRESTNDRIELWKQAILLVKNCPWFGVGPMHFAWHSNANAHPHNSILQLASEWGLPATLIILTITGYGIYKWLNKFNSYSLITKSKIDGDLAIILFFTIIANLAYSLVDGVIVMPISQVLMFTIIGFAVAHYAYDNAKKYNFYPKLNSVFASLVLIALVWSTYPEISRGLSGDEKGFSVGYSALGPRYWKEIQ
jgi:putative inorganic carbon (hco3(-)) transporter